LADEKPRSRYIRWIAPVCNLVRGGPLRRVRGIVHVVKHSRPFAAGRDTGAGVESAAQHVIAKMQGVSFTKVEISQAIAALVRTSRQSPPTLTPDAISTADSSRDLLSFPAGGMRPARPTAIACTTLTSRKRRTLFHSAPAVDRPSAGPGPDRESL